MTHRNQFDVAIIGAGAAGLAAAGLLQTSNLRIIILEARERLGGRICSHREPGLAVPIELGAEFIHGEAPETQALLTRAGIASVDIDGHRFQARRGRLIVADDYWQRIHSVMRHLKPSAEHDESFRQFLDRQPGGSSNALNRRLALLFIEGFQAADARLISAKSTADDGDPSSDLAAQRAGRVVDGYDRVIEALASPVESMVRRAVVVTRVKWKRGSVEIESKSAGGRARPVIHARRVIVTVPLGVLKAPVGETGAIEFVPALEDKLEAIDKMAMGTVVRIVLRFKSRFWTEDWFARRAKTDSLESLSFIQTEDHDFPVWWTQYPLRTPIITGWRGGPAARLLDRLPQDHLVDRAVSSLARACGLTARRLRAMLVDAWTHHWDDDPFSRGAYSYQMVGGADAPEALARPVRGTVFIAGEATAPDGRIGTVDGAIASGQRAAKQVMRGMRK